MAAGAYAAASEEDTVEIGPDRLVKVEPELATAIAPGGVFDPVLAQAGFPVCRWADLTEEVARDAISGLLSVGASAQFEAMLCALAPRDGSSRTFRAFPRISLIFVLELRKPHCDSL
jgi:hypothetical protein